MSEAAWNVLVFLNAKNNLERFSFENFHQMAAVGSTNDVNILVEYGRPKQRPGGLDAGYSTDYGGWSKTLRFHVQRGQQPEPGAAIDDLGSTNMGDAKSLAAFVKWARETHPAKHTLLVIWDHGQGWRVDVEGGSAPRTMLTGGVRYVSHDDDSGDKLYNRAIQDALGDLLGTERLDVIAFDACLMAMVETAYAFRSLAHVMVGSEELEPGTGWNYRRWLEPLVHKHGDVSPAELGALIVGAMKDEYGDDSKTTLSSLDLGRVDGLASSLTAFAEAAAGYMTEDTVGFFKAARFACKNYAPGHGLHSIDLARFMDQLRDSGASAEVKAKAAAVREHVDSTVRANYASKLRQDKYGSHGLAIYFPKSGTAYERDPDGDGYAADNQLFPVEFVQKEQWAEFLRRYWKLVPTEVP